MSHFLRSLNFTARLIYNISKDEFQEGYILGLLMLCLCLTLLIMNIIKALMSNIFIAFLYEVNVYIFLLVTVMETNLINLTNFAFPQDQHR
jgi:hypothetical protein